MLPPLGDSLSKLNRLPQDQEYFDQLLAVDHVSFQVYKGEIVGLLGPNGAGKTTILRMLAAILPPSEGTAKIFNFDICKSPLEVKRRIGFLSGGTALYRRLSPRELLYCFGKFYNLSHRQIQSRIDELAAELELLPFIDQPCGTLSAGQQQRVNIARTMIHDPPMLILDEPTTALDVITGQFLRETLQVCRKKGKGILFSTHHMDTAEYLCDRLFLLHRGKILATGSLSSILNLAQASNLTEAFLNLIRAAEEHHSNDQHR
ncbi:MAG: ATP-binding cassette domain-containing protein [Candidatus Bathyarchaeia archaeon]